MIDEAAQYWKSEAERFLAKRGAQPGKPSVRLHVARVTPHDVPGLLPCEAKLNGVRCCKVPDLFVWYSDQKLGLQGAFFCQDHYVKRVANLMLTQNFEEVRHDKMPDWYQKWLDATYVFQQVES